MKRCEYIDERNKKIVELENIYSKIDIAHQDEHFLKIMKESLEKDIGLLILDLPVISDFLSLQELNRKYYQYQVQKNKEIISHCTDGYIEKYFDDFLFEDSGQIYQKIFLLSRLKDEKILIFNKKTKRSDFLIGFNMNWILDCYHNIQRIAGWSDATKQNAWIQF